MALYCFLEQIKIEIHDLQSWRGNCTWLCWGSPEFAEVTPICVIEDKPSFVVGLLCVWYPFFLTVKGSKRMVVEITHTNFDVTDSSILHSSLSCHSPLE